MQRRRLEINLPFVRCGICISLLATLAACATRFDPAPIVDLSSSQGASVMQSGVLQPPPAGYYRVKPGDTVSRIALLNGQSFHDIVTWNNLADPDQLEVNQLLRVVPPAAVTAPLEAGVSTAPVADSTVQSAPLGAATGTIGAGPGDERGASPGNFILAWPVHGPVVSGFDTTRNKGIDIGGVSGEPIRAAAGGRVVYAGNGLRGYGNLVIIKDNSTFLTAYAHNRVLLVKEGDPVTQGQEIAEMGNTDSDRVALHFELRREGKPVDPVAYLPPQ
jgi:lipoprotein NlpD